MKTKEQILDAQLEPEDQGWNINHLRAMEEYKDQSVKHLLTHILALAQQADRKPNAVKEIIDYCNEQLKS